MPGCSEYARQALIEHRLARGAALAARGKGVIVISSEMQELIGVCHRILVMRGGQIAGEVSGEAMTEAEIVVHATGVSKEEARAQI